MAPGDPDPHHHSARAAGPLITTRPSSVKRDCGIGRRDLRARLKEREIEEDPMGFGRGLLLWLLGIPLPIILLLALFWR